MKVTFEGTLEEVQAAIERRARTIAEQAADKVDGGAYSNPLGAMVDWVVIQITPPGEGYNTGSDDQTIHLYGWESYEQALDDAVWRVGQWPQANVSVHRVAYFPAVTP